MTVIKESRYVNSECRHCRNYNTHLCTSPSIVTAKQWLSPQAICLILIPCNALIGCGVNRSLEFPCPNLPKSPLQNNTDKNPQLSPQKKNTQCPINHQTPNKKNSLNSPPPTVHLQLSLRVGSSVISSASDRHDPRAGQRGQQRRKRPVLGVPVPELPVLAPAPRAESTVSCKHVRPKLKRPFLRS